MLREILIKDLVLVDFAHLILDKGLIIITGETGAGKSVLLDAIRLSLGAKADERFIRLGEEKAIIEAIFQLDHKNIVFSFLTEAGIEFDDHELFIKREITKSGKNRIWINQQPVRLEFLKKVGTFLAKIIDQNTHQELLLKETQRNLLDIFADLNPLQKKFKEHLQKTKFLKKELDELYIKKEKQEKEIEKVRLEKEEILTIDPRQGEEEELFSEYSFLSHAEDRQAFLFSLLQIFDHDESGLFPIFREIRHLFEKLKTMDPKFNEGDQTIKNMFIELQDLSQFIQKEHASFSFDEKRKEEIQERLTSFSKLKRKYGQTIEDVLSYLQQLSRICSSFETMDQKIESIKKEWEKQKKETDDLAKELSEKRKTAKEEFSSFVEKELSSLNMPHAQFSIEMILQERNEWGDDQIEFFLAPNLGEKSSSLKNGTSGGELARVWLSIQTLLSKKIEYPLLVFDEVDANIGGLTAKTIGEKLKTLSYDRQVFSVTHFPQVAKIADMQIQIQKYEKEGRTFSQMQTLSEKEKEKEFARMSGLND